MSEPTQETNKLKEVALLFLKLGSTAFGGPASHIAMMEQEIVQKRKWISPQHFLDLIGATNLIPGPNSTEMTMHCGHERAGWKGLITAGVCFLFPAVTLTMILAFVYTEYGTLPAVEPFFSGIRPAVIALILNAVFKLGKKAVKTKELAFYGLLTFIACVAGLNEIIALFSCGLLVLVVSKVRQKSSLQSFSPLMLSAVLGNLSQWKIFFSFLKVGALLYGSGYVLFAYLDAELVAKGLLSRQQLLDAIAMGQFTPGPVLSTATFIGWQLHGFWGALAATLGIFLPSFIFVALLNPLVAKVKTVPTFRIFLDGVNVAAVAIILAVCVSIGKETFVDWRNIVIAAISVFVVFRFKKLNSAFIVFGGAALGFLLSMIG